MILWNNTSTTNCAVRTLIPLGPAHNDEPTRQMSAQSSEITKSYHFKSNAVFCAYIYNSENVT